VLHCDFAPRGCTTISTASRSGPPRKLGLRHLSTGASASFITTPSIVLFVFKLDRI
jgi:hypothetical protein